MKFQLENILWLTCLQQDSLKLVALRTKGRPGEAKNYVKFKRATALAQNVSDSKFKNAFNKMMLLKAIHT